MGASVGSMLAPPLAAWAILLYNWQFYNWAKFHYLYLCRDEVHGKHLRLMSALPGQPSADAFSDPIPVHFEGPLELAAAELRCQHTFRRSHRAGIAEFYGRLCSVGMACQDLRLSTGSRLCVVRVS